MTKIVKSEDQKIVLPALMEKGAIKSGQDKIKINLLTLDVEIHNNAVQCLMHAEKHGDTSLMTRLLMEIVDEKSGYRRQGLIAWMRAYSPMQLSGKVINLSGVDEEGNKRPFRVAEANANPFKDDKRFKEQVKPVFQDTALSPIDRAVDTIVAAMENTVNGKPVDASKPFYDGIHGDKVIDFARKVKEMKAALPADATRDVRLAEKRIAQDTNFVKSATADNRPEDPNNRAPVEPLQAVG